MKQVTKAEWLAAKKQGYTEVKEDGSTWLLYWGERGTTWGNGSGKRVEQ